MFNDRRKFMIATGMAAGATMLGQLGASEKFPEGGTPQADVSYLVSQYAKVQSISKAPGGLTKVSARIRCHQSMAKVLTAQHKMPFDQIRVIPGNSIELTHRGERFLITHQV